MTSLDEIRSERIKKANLLKEKGVDPYPIFSRSDLPLKDVLTQFKKLSKRKATLFLTGRVVGLRLQGGMVFFDFDDGTGVLQGFFKKDESKGDSFSLFTETIDVGDHIQVRGNLFVTKRGEKTILIKEWLMLAKSLRPLPDKWHGLSDTEEKLRRRYLDTLTSLESKERFLFRSRLIREIRSFLNENEFVEVETPTLQPLYGGGSALPFTTHHNALDVDLYLRISNELYLKRLLVGGFPKVYEIYKGFRNEGIDLVHYPEFTMLEFYESYSDAKKQMKFVELFIKALVKKLLSKKALFYDEGEIDLSKKFNVIPFFDVLKRYAGVENPEKISRDVWATHAKKCGLEVDDGDNEIKLMDLIFKKVCRSKLIQPTFLIDYPLNYLPLAKEKKSSQSADSPRVADVFQLVIGGVELVKAFSELNDPLEQKIRFEEQEELRRKGDKEAQPLDEDFIEAMEYGMPPAGGVGIGIDRLAMLLTGTKNIKDIILFPSMRPKS